MSWLELHKSVQSAIQQQHEIGRRLQDCRNKVKQIIFDMLLRCAYVVVPRMPTSPRSFVKVITRVVGG